MLSIVSLANETVTQSTENKIEIQKKSGRVVVHANVPLSIIPTKMDRVFNMVPGMEAIPIVAHFSDAVEEIVCTIRVL